MKIVYPSNIKEKLISAIPNCTTMVFGMMSLNLWIYGVLTWEHFLSALPKIYFTAFCLDFFIVGPIVTRIVKKYNLVKCTPLIRVFCMAGILTAVAPVLETGHVVAVERYFMALPRNYIAALLLQVGIAFPFGMFVLAKYRSIQA